MKTKLFNRGTAGWLLLGLLVPVLAGCFGAAVVGVGAGALMLADRRPTDTYITDEAIETRSGNRISEKFGDKVHVNVTSYNRAALLTGEVLDITTKAEVEKLVSGVPNVKAITNELQIAGASSFGSRSNDAYISSKVKARFIDANRFSVNHVKVITEAGVVYLLGIVTKQEADAAVEITRTTSGVQRVVRVFEYIAEEQARLLDNPAPERSAEKKPVSR
jgi:osmotically-inducible protein OsmY